MRTYLEKERLIPAAASVDVLVLGGGPAGFSAAVNAAREGAETLLLEQSGDVGGVSTIGLMSHWTGRTSGGFYEEILDRSADTASAPAVNGASRQTINPERLKTAYLEMLEEARVRLRLYTFASEPILEGNKLKGIVTESKSGREAVFAKIVIDATGDGDIAAKAGVPFFKGREEDGKMQPVTLMFKVAGVDYDRAVFPGAFEETIEIPKGEIQALGKAYLPFPSGHVLLYKSSLPGVVTCNMTNCIDIDGTSAEDLTKATVVCRHQMYEIEKFLREYVPGFENCYIISSASSIGVRETRHFKGEKTITEEDILEARVFDDWVVTRANFNFDVHNISGNGLDATGAQKKFPQKKGYTIPYGCLVPQKIDGLLLAGRNISGTHMAHSNFRVMPICANMGQAAGIAASLCVKKGLEPRELPVKELQKRLGELGVEP
jgi:glycine/D-amino acid oxidase-like deaminating enzyme